MFKNLNLFRGKDGECQRGFLEDGFLALHSGSWSSCCPSTPLLTIRFTSITPAVVGIPMCLSWLWMR